MATEMAEVSNRVNFGSWVWAPDMSGKVRTTWISDDIGTCPEKKVWNSVSGKYRTSLHLIILKCAASNSHSCISLICVKSVYANKEEVGLLSDLYQKLRVVHVLGTFPPSLTIGGLPMCVLSYILAWHRGSSGQRPWVRLLHSLVSLPPGQALWRSIQQRYETVNGLAVGRKQTRHCIIPS